MTRRSFVIVALVIALAGACNAGAPTPEPNASQVTATASRGDVRVTLTLLGPPRSDAVSWADLRIENAGARAIRWAGGGCGDPGGIDIDLSAALEAGRDWPGRLGAFKRLAMGQAGGPVGSPANVGYEAATRWRQNLACTADLRIEQLDAGRSLAFRAGWDGMLNGRPAPAGAATVQGVFPLIGVAGEVPDDRFEAEPLIVRIDAAVVGSGAPAAMPPGLAIDAALGDPEFAAFVQAADPSTWVNPTLDIVDTGWAVGLFRNGNPVSRTLLGQVTVDGTGRIVARRFEP